jgi:hypothetical protein
MGKSAPPAERRKSTLHSTTLFLATREAGISFLLLGAPLGLAPLLSQSLWKLTIGFDGSLTADER